MNEKVLKENAKDLEDAPDQVQANERAMDDNKSIEEMVPRMEKDLNKELGKILVQQRQ